MLFLSLYKPVALPAQPSREDAARIGEYAQRSINNGTLLSTGPLARRETGGARVSLAMGRVTVQTGAELDSTLMRAAGYALINAASREEAIRQVSEFMKIAGDGEVELLAVSEMSPQ